MVEMMFEWCSAAAARRLRVHLSAPTEENCSTPECRHLLKSFRFPKIACTLHNLSYLIQKHGRREGFNTPICASAGSLAEDYF